LSLRCGKEEALALCCLSSTFFYEVFKYGACVDELFQLSDSDVFRMMNILALDSLRESAM
jgi:hypothetical protein